MTSVAKIHLSINVRDVKKSTAWYADLFGIEPHKERPGYANFDVATPPIKLALNESRIAPGGALNHLGILVDTTAEVEKEKARLEAAGMETQTEESVTCCHAVQDKFWVKDPDGNAWEVYTILDDLVQASAWNG